jgi:hypothetical protein
MSAQATYRKSTYGHILVVSTGYDLTGYTALTLYLRKPDSSQTVLTKTPTVYGTDAGGKVQYTFVAGDLDTVGEWRADVQVDKGATVRVRSQVSGKFSVTDNFTT